MVQVVDLNRPVTQSEFGEIVGISQQAVSDLVARGVIRPGDSVGQWLKDDRRHLREVAAGRASAAGGALDLVQERAALAREQRESVAIKNAVARREYAPVELLTKVLSDACAAVVERLEALPSRLRKEVPDLPIEAHEAIGAVIAAARNEWLRAASESMLRQAPTDETGADDGDALEEAVA